MLVDVAAVARNVVGDARRGGGEDAGGCDCSKRDHTHDLDMEGWHGLIRQQAFVLII